MAQRQFRSDDTSTWSEKFGNGSDGAHSPITATDAQPNTTLTGTADATAATAGSGTGFTANNLVIIHQTQGTGAGNWELNRISSIGGGTDWTMAYPLINTYTTGAQVYKLNQYTSANIAGGVTITGQAWNGSKGGIYGFICSGDATIAGTITVAAKGFRGGTGDTSPGASFGAQGESSTGVGSEGSGQNGSAGGGGQSVGDAGGGGAGSSHGGSGANGTAGNSGSTGGSVGATQGTPGLTTMFLAAGGGGGGIDDSPGPGGSGGAGGGIVIIIAKNITISGSVTSNAGNGTTGGDSGGGGGGGSGGSVLLKGQTIDIGATKITVAAGTGASGNSAFGGIGGNGGVGGVGRIHADYLTIISGSSSPTIDSRQDLSLIEAGSYAYFL